MKKIFILGLLFVLTQSSVFAIELVVSSKGDGKIIAKVAVAERNIGNSYKYFVECEGGKKYYTSDRSAWKGSGYNYSIFKSAQKICRVSRVNF
jgi:hypothetical protein